MSGPILRRIVVLPFVVLVAVWSLLPIYWILNLSFQPRIELFTVPASLLPKHPTLLNYITALGLLKGDVAEVGGTLGNVPRFLAGFKNSLMVATTVMILTIAMCVPAAYSFARFSFRFRTSIFALILLARSFPPISTAIPYYQFYKDLGQLGTYQGIILVHLTLTVPLTIWVLSGFISSLPIELDRQARIDGCSRLQMLRLVVLPVAAPGVAAVAILAWLDSWNEFLYALLLADVKGLPFVSPQVAMNPGLSSVSPGIYLAFVAITMVPSIIAAVFLTPYMTRLRIGDPLTFRTPN